MLVINNFWIFFLGFIDQLVVLVGVKGAEKIYLGLQEKSEVIGHCWDHLSPWMCPNNYLLSCLSYESVYFSLCNLF